MPPWADKKPHAWLPKGGEETQKGQKHPRVVKLQSPSNQKVLAIVITDAICVRVSVFLHPQRNFQAVAFKLPECFLKYMSS